VTTVSGNGGATRGGTQPAAPVPVLLYHSVHPDGGGLMRRYTLTPSLFRSHLAWIADQGFETLTVSQYAGALRGEVPLPVRPLVVTFDDGYADFLDEAMPLLSEYRIRGTLYVTTRPVGETRRGKLAGRPMLTWPELRHLVTLGVEIGAHGHDHTQLDLLSPARALDQITTCKRLLDEHLPTEVRSFAYPHGYNSAATRRAVRRAGFSSACAVKNARSHQGDDPWALSRIMFEHDDGVDLLRRACQSDAFPVGAAGDTIKSRAWRAARRIRVWLRPGTLSPPTIDGDTSAVPAGCTYADVGPPGRRSPPDAGGPPG
jgi:peptidoglycan/xylan/chitin deacetylase (PgdA/CDA1 family)